MADVVVFPGSTDHIETEDVNLLDADTAHLVQTIGQWEGVSRCSVADDGIQADGWGQLAATVTDDGTCIFGADDTPDIPIVGIPAGTYTWSVEIDNTTAGTVDTEFVIFVDGGVTYGEHIDVLPGVARYSITATLPAGDITHLRLYFGSVLTGDAFKMSKFCFSEGTDPTFVASLNIVGTLGETIKPPDMPIVYAADGTPLTVGEGWAGEGVEYTRYDGAVGVGPIVAQFLASDLP